MWKNAKALLQNRRVKIYFTRLRQFWRRRFKKNDYNQLKEQKYSRLILNWMMRSNNDDDKTLLISMLMMCARRRLELDRKKIIYWFSCFVSLFSFEIKQKSLFESWLLLFLVNSHVLASYIKPRRRMKIFHFPCHTLNAFSSHFSISFLPFNLSSASRHGDIDWISVPTMMMNGYAQNHTCCSFRT